MSGPVTDMIDKATVEAVRLIAARAGVTVDAEAAVELGRRGAELLVQLVDDHAKKHAAAAGQAASDAVTTEDAAELAQRKHP